MTHDEVTEVLAAYALGAVSPDEASLVADHVAQCDECRVSVAEYRVVVASLAFSRRPPWRPTE